MRFDLHVHSVNSGDSSNSVEEILEICARRGLAGVAIMDHNSLKGFEKARSLRRDGLLVVPGMEVSSADGHILAYNIQEEVPRDLSAAETIDAIRAQGGVAVAAHPYRIWSGLGEEVTTASDFDALEAHNGRSTLRHNRMAMHLARSVDRPVTAGSDSHEPRTVGSVCFETEVDCRSVDDLLKAILKGQGSTVGGHRPRASTVRYGTKCIGQWMGRGLKRM